MVTHKGAAPEAYPHPTSCDFMPWMLNARRVQPSLLCMRTATTFGCLVDLLVVICCHVTLRQVPALSIYRALELGEKDAHQMAPFPASMLGIYSCHGAEPGWEGEEVRARCVDWSGASTAVFLVGAGSVFSTPSYTADGCRHCRQCRSTKRRSQIPALFGSTNQG